MKLLIRAYVLCFSVYCLTTVPCSAAQAIDSKPPSAPAGLCVSYRTFTSLSLSWNKSEDNTGVKGYQVFRDGRKIVSVTKTSYINTGLVPGQGYTYSIKAYDAAGNLSEGSIPLKVSTVSDLKPPSAPSGMSVSYTGYTSVNLIWEPSSDNVGIKKYEVYRNGTKVTTAVKAGCICKGLAPGGKYTFTVKAIDTAGNYSASSNAVTVETAVDRSAPSVPGDLRTVEVTGTEVKLCWSASSDNVRVKGYKVLCNGTEAGKPSHETYICKNLIPGKSYTFTVIAVDSSGNLSAPCKTLYVKTVADLKAPSIPGGLKVKSTKGTSVSLAWEASTDNIKVKGYNVYCNGIKIATTTRKSCTAKISKGFGIYTYTVRAYDLAGNLSEKSKAVTVVGLP